MNNAFDHDDPKLTAFALGELDAAEAAAIEARLTHDASLRAVVDEIRQTAQVLRNEFAAEPAMALTPQQRERIEQQPIPEVISHVGGPLAFRARTWWMGAGIAAAACVAFAFGLSLYVNRPGDKKDYALHGQADELQSKTVAESDEWQQSGIDEKKWANARSGGKQPAPVAGDLSNLRDGQGGKDSLGGKETDQGDTRLSMPIPMTQPPPMTAAPPPPIPGPVASPAPASAIAAEGRARGLLDADDRSGDGAPAATATAGRQPVADEKSKQHDKNASHEIQPADTAASAPPPPPPISMPGGLGKVRDPMARSIQSPEPPPAKTAAPPPSPAAVAPSKPAHASETPPSGGGFGGGRAGGAIAGDDQRDETRSFQSVIADPPEVDFGEIPTNEIGKATITLVNRSDKPATIVSPRSTGGSTDLRIASGTIIPAGGSLSIPIQMAGGNREMEFHGKTVTVVVEGQSELIIPLKGRAVSYVALDPPALDPYIMPEGKFTLKSKDGLPFLINSIQPPLITDFPTVPQTQYELTFSWARYRELGPDRQCMVYVDHPKCKQVFVPINWTPQELSQWGGHQTRPVSKGPPASNGTAVGLQPGTSSVVAQVTETKSQNLVIADPPEIDLGEIPTNDSVKGIIRLVNKSDEQKTLVSARASCGCTTLDLTPGTVLVPGQAMDVPIQMAGGNREMEIHGKTVTFVISGQPEVVVSLKAKAISFVTIDPPVLDPQTMPEGKFKLKSRDGTPFRITSMLPPVIIDFPKEPQSEYDLSLSWKKYRELGIDRPCTIYLDHPKCQQLFVQVNWTPEELAAQARERQKGDEAPKMAANQTGQSAPGGGRPAPSAPSKAPARGAGGLAGGSAPVPPPPPTQYRPAGAKEKGIRDDDALREPQSPSDSEGSAPASVSIPEPLTEDQIKSMTLADLNTAAQKIANVRTHQPRGEVNERLVREFKMLMARIRELRGPGNENYQLISDNPFIKPVGVEALSTFSIDVDTASYANVRQMVLDEKRLPPKDAVRIEEMINYFSYSYEPPSGDQPFSAAVEVNAAPWNPAHRLVRIGLKGREIKMDMRPATSLVFLVDVSGSMQAANKLPLVQNALMMLVEKLNADDRLAIVTYAGQAGLELDSKFVNQENKQNILNSIGALTAGGSTNGAGGIVMAYDVAVKHFIKGGVNRVVLCTDGDFNVGVSSDGELVHLIEQQRKTGVFLSVLGFGTGNYQDAKMQQLADAGNGNHSYIDTMQEARKVLVDQMCGTLITIAKDVKIQVEFNPAKVGMYRLIGYENRMLAAEDFNNDKKDAGEIGAGHTVTALYEVVPPGVSAGIAGEAPPVDDLKYQKNPSAVPVEAGTAGDELLTLKLRYKQPDGEESKLMQIPVKDKGTAMDQATPDFRFAAAVASFGMILRESPYKGNSSIAGVLDLAAGGAGPDPNGYRNEFVGIVERARSIMEALKAH